MDLENVKYDAFISYRHCELDQFVAVNLHKKLENFKLPKYVLNTIKEKNEALQKEGKPVLKTHIHRVFRDEDELPLSDNLSDPIDHALANSEFLIVICTPRLSQSLWCLKEIRTFLQTHDRKHILVVLAEGEPDESFPEILTYEEYQEMDQEGNAVTVRRQIEPLAADTRGNNKRNILKAMDNAVIKLAAAMFGLNYDDLRQRHREQRVKKLARIGISIGVAVLTFAIVCLILLTKISAQKNELQEKYAATMAQNAVNMLDEGLRNEAIYGLLSVLPNSGDYNSEAYRMLVKSVNPYGTGLIPTTNYRISSNVAGYQVSPEGNYVAVLGATNDYHLYDVNGQELNSWPSTYVDNDLTRFAFDGEEGLVYSDADGVYYVTPEDEPMMLMNQPGYIMAGNSRGPVAVLADNKMAAIQGGKVIYSLDLKDYGVDGRNYVYKDSSTSQDGQFCANIIDIDGDKWLFRVDHKKGDLDVGFQVDLKSLYGTENLDSLVVATSADYIYLIGTIYDGMYYSYLYKVDAATLRPVMYKEMEAGRVRGALLTGAGLCIYSNDKALLLDANSLEDKGLLSSASTIIGVYPYEREYVCLVDRFGGTYLLGGNYAFGVNMRDTWFDIAPGNDVINCKMAGNKFWYQYGDDNYVTLYEPKDDTLAVRLESNEKYESIETAAIAGEIQHELPSDVDADNVYCTVKSSNDRYLAIMMQDGSLRIYDAKSGDLKKVLYDLGNVMGFAMEYVEQMDAYLIVMGSYTYVFDEDLNHISDMGQCIGYTSDGLVIKMTDGNYKVPYIDYRQMLDKAREVIGDYEPDERTAERWGL